MHIHKKGISRGLINAAVCGDLEEFKGLVEVSPWSINLNSDSPIRNAAYYGNLNIVKFILETLTDTADIRISAKQALIGSATGGHLDIVKYIVSFGVDIEVWDNAAIRNAIRFGHLSTVRYLISVGAEFVYDRFKLPWNEIPLHEKLGMEYAPESREEMLSILDMFLVNKE